MYKILPHTADFAVNFSTNNFNELLKDIVVFFNKEIYKNNFFDKSKKKDVILENLEEDLSYFIIDILNEIIFHGEINYRIVQISSIKENRVKLMFLEDNNLEMDIELKAATYHNLTAIMSSEQINITVVFDL